MFLRDISTINTQKMFLKHILQNVRICLHIFVLILLISFSWELDTIQYSNEWNVLKSRGLHFIHLNINSLSSKIKELRFITKSTNAAVIDICESKLALQC